MWNRILDKMLRDFIQEGALAVTFANGETRRYGSPDASYVEITFSDPDLPRKIVSNPDLAVGEAYMDGRLTITNDDLEGFLTLVVRNSGLGDKVWWRRLNAWRLYLGRLANQWNPKSASKANVAHHYDLSAKLYDLFLDEGRQYSCGYFVSPEVSLEEAQRAKQDHIARKLLIEPGMEILEIGSGWGGLSMKLAQDYGARVLGITLSEEQLAYATRQAQDAGLADRVRFELQDYREIQGQFDRIVSVGMFEHVGVPHYAEFFGVIDARLKTDGIALLHTIGRSYPPGGTSPWLRKYIFPGGYTPALSEVMSRIERSGLYNCDVEVWRLHYAKTLHHWFERFTTKRAEAIELFDERFYRMWRYYLKACEMTFLHNRQCVFQIQLAKKQESVPISRDYLYRS